VHRQLVICFARGAEMRVMAGGHNGRYGVVRQDREDLGLARQQSGSDSGSAGICISLTSGQSKNRCVFSRQTLTDFRDSVTRVLVTSEEILTTSVDGCVRTFDVRSGYIQIDKCHEPLSSLALSYDGKPDAPRLSTYPSTL
jgi:WD40 repeat protein